MGGLGGFPPHYRAYWPFAKEQCFGGFGGVSPHYRAYLAPSAPRGGVGGDPPPIIGRTRPPGINRGGPGRGGSNGAGPVRGICRGVVVVCSSLSVAGRTSPRCLARLRPNFRWRSGSWSGTFISGTGPIAQGTGKKRAGNLNFGRSTLYYGGCFG